MNELNWLVVVRTKASKFEPEYKNVVAAFNSLVLAENGDFKQHSHNRLYVYNTARQILAN